MALYSSLGDERPGLVFRKESVVLGVFILKFNCRYTFKLNLRERCEWKRGNNRAYSRHVEAMNKSDGMGKLD